MEALRSYVNLCRAAQRQCPCYSQDWILEFLQNNRERCAITARNIFLRDITCIVSYERSKDILYCFVCLLFPNCHDCAEVRNHEFTLKPVCVSDSTLQSS
jgi:hypothetical protein